MTIVKLPSRVTGTLQSAAVSLLSISQVVACFKYIPPTSLLGLATQILSIGGLYVGARWGIENIIEKYPELTMPKPQPAVQLPAPAPALVVQPPQPPITLPRSIPAAKGKTRGFTKHMLDAILEADVILIDKKDRGPIKTVNDKSLSLDPINGFKDEEIFFTANNYGLVINEYARYLINNRHFNHPYMNIPLNKKEVTQLLEYPIIKNTVSLYRIPVNNVPLQRSHRHLFDREQVQERSQNQLPTKTKM